MVWFDTEMGYRDNMFIYITTTMSLTADRDLDVSLASWCHSPMFCTLTTSQLPYGAV